MTGGRPPLTAAGAGRGRAVPSRRGLGGLARRRAARRRVRGAAAGPRRARAAGPRAAGRRRGRRRSRSSTRSRLSARWVIVGANPAIEARVRTTSLVGGVAGVDDPVVVAEAAEHVQRVRRRGRHGITAGTPRPQGADHSGSRPDRRRRARPAPGCSRRSAPGRRRRRRAAPSASAGSCSSMRSRHRGMGARRGRRRAAAASGGWRSRSPATRNGAGGLGVRVEVEPGRVDRGEDRHRVLGEPPPGRGQPDPAPVRLDQRGARPRGPARRSAATPSRS